MLVVFVFIVIYMSKISVHSCSGETDAKIITWVIFSSSKFGFFYTRKLKCGRA